MCACNDGSTHSSGCMVYASMMSKNYKPQVYVSAYKLSCVVAILHSLLSKPQV